MKAIEITEFGAPEVLQAGGAADAAAESGRGADQGGGVGRQSSGRVPAQGRLSAAAGRVGPAGPGGGGRDRRRHDRREEQPVRSEDRRPRLRAAGRRRLRGVLRSRRCCSACRCRRACRMSRRRRCPETFFTVWSNVFDRAQLGKGEGAPNETLLVQGGSSGIGVTAIQIAQGARRFACSSPPAPTTSAARAKRSAPSVRSTTRPKISSR